MVRQKAQLTLCLFSLQKTCILQKNIYIPGLLFIPSHKKTYMNQSNVAESPKVPEVNKTGTAE